MCKISYPINLGRNTLIYNFPLCSYCLTPGAKKPINVRCRARPSYMPGRVDSSCDFALQKSEAVIRYRRISGRLAYRD